MQITVAPQPAGLIQVNAVNLPTVATTVGMPMQTIAPMGVMPMQTSPLAVNVQSAGIYGNNPQIVSTYPNPTFASASNPPIGQPVGHYYPNGGVQLFNAGKSNSLHIDLAYAY